MLVLRALRHAPWLDECWSLERAGCRFHAFSAPRYLLSAQRFPRRSAAAPALSSRSGAPPQHAVSPKSSPANRACCRSLRRADWDRRSPLRVASVPSVRPPGRRPEQSSLAGTTREVTRAAWPPFARQERTWFLRWWVA